MGSFQYGMNVFQVATTATAGATTTLTNTSKQIEVFTGSSTQTVILPNATTMSVGQFFEIYNQSTGSLTLQFNGGAAFTDAAGTSYGTLTSNGAITVKLQTNGTSAGTWSVATSGNNASTNPMSAAGQMIYGASGGTPTAVAAGTAGQLLMSDGTGAPVFSGVNTSQINLGLSTAVASNALTITLTQSDGSSAPTATKPVIIAERSSTATTGGYNLRSVTSSINIVVPSGASLGQASALNQYVWVYALDNAGTIELAVSGVTLFADNSIQSTTAIGAGSTSGTTLYSTTARTNVPIRLIGRLLVNETTAGTWASAPTDVVTSLPMPAPTVTDWVSFQSAGSFTSGGFTRLPGTVHGAQWRRVGDSMEVMCDYTASGAATGTVVFSIPTTNTIDTGKIYSSSAAIGKAWALINDSWSATPQLTNTTTFSFRTDQGVNGSNWGTAVPEAAWTNGSVVGLFVKVPIVGWSTYGPQF